MKEVTKVRLRWIAFVIFLVSVVAVGVMAQQLANAKREASIAQANSRALVDTVRVYQTELTMFN